MAEILLDGVSRVFPGGVRAVERLDLSIQDGELLALVGPSGCGKSTTLRLIAGLDFPTAGRIRLDGRDVAGVPVRERHIAMLFQRVGLFPHRTAFDNIAFGLRLRSSECGFRRRLRRGELDEAADHSGGSASEIDERVKAAATLTRIESLLDRRPGELSGGEQQRVALAKVLAMHPRAMLLDEPFSQLDAALRSALGEELRKLHEQRRVTTCFVTHDQREALAIGDRVAVMNRGAIEQVGTPQEIFDRPTTRFVAEFVGEPAMSVFAATVGEVEGRTIGRWCGNNVRLPPEVARVVATRNANGVTWGVRPEDVRISHGDESGAGREGESPGGVGGTGHVSQVAFQGGASVVCVKLTAKQNRDSGEEGNGELRVLVSGRDTFRPGELVRWNVNPATVHWFDSETGTNLRP